MPFMSTERTARKELIAKLKLKNDKRKGLIATRNLFYDLPFELQTKILFINVLCEMAFNDKVLDKKNEFFRTYVAYEWREYIMANLHLPYRSVTDNFVIKCYEKRILHNLSEFGLPQYRVIKGATPGMLAIANNTLDIEKYKSK